MSFLFPCYQSSAPQQRPEINAESPGKHPSPRNLLHYAKLNGSLLPHLPHPSSLTLTAQHRPLKFISLRPGQALSVKPSRASSLPWLIGGGGGRSHPREGLGERLVRDTQLITARINLVDLLPGERRGVNTVCAEAAWRHNVSVYRKNINRSSLWLLIDGGDRRGTAERWQ